ncbi:helix-turn-helix transcriptional regulator [Neobacillus drentensis]|uniref:helix-turn-helix transcriptional regulator n=1 Tax=Neobacillus drentensis TaxID=220684 RepID=UPI002FFF5E88
MYKRNLIRKFPWILLQIDCIYNPNYLSNVFKKEYGENFVDYLMNYRLQMAQTLLKDTDLAIKEIAERLQYRNSQNFIRFFKKKLGMTPGDYRKEYMH